MKYVFRFSLFLLSERFLTLRGTERDMIKKKSISLHLKYPFFKPDFNKA